MRVQRSVPPSMAASCASSRTRMAKRSSVRIARTRGRWRSRRGRGSGAVPPASRCRGRSHARLCPRSCPAAGPVPGPADRAWPAWPRPGWTRRSVRPGRAGPAPAARAACPARRTRACCGSTAATPPAYHRQSGRGTARTVPSAPGGGPAEAREPHGLLRVGPQRHSGPHRCQRRCHVVRRLPSQQCVCRGEPLLVMGLQQPLPPLLLVIVEPGLASAVPGETSARRWLWVPAAACSGSRPVAPAAWRPRA
jgi:hypothetical protein